MGRDNAPGGAQESVAPVGGTEGGKAWGGKVVRDITKLFNWSGWTAEDSTAQWNEIKKLQGQGADDGGGGGTVLPDMSVIINGQRYTTGLMTDGSLVQQDDP